MAFNRKIKNTTIATTSHQGAQLSEISGTASSINGSGNSVSMLDGGAVNDAFSFAGSNVKNAFDFVRDFTKSANVLQNQTIDKAMQATSEAMANSLQAAQPKPVDPVILAIAGAVIVGLVYFGHK